MAGAYETDFVSNTHRVRDVREKMIEQIAMDTPVTATLPRGPRPMSSTPEWPIKTYNAPRTTGVLEGAIGTYQNNLANKGMLAGRFQKQDRNPEVTKEAQLLVKQYAVKKSTFDDNLADCYAELNVDVEATVLSDNESVATVASSTASKTRGMLRWLSIDNGRFSDAPTTPAAAYRPNADQIVASKTNATDVTEAEITGLIKAVAKARKKSGKGFTGVVTPDLSDHIGGMSISRDAGSSFETFPVYGWSQKLGEINREVQVIRTNLGRLALLTSFQLDSTVAHMVLLDREMLSLDYAQKPTLTKDPNKTTGERGVLDVIYVNCVLNPQAHGKIQVGATK